MKIGSPCLLLAKCWVIIHHIVNHTDMDHMDVLYIQGSIKLDAAPILPCLHFHLLGNQRLQGENSSRIRSRESSNCKAVEKHFETHVFNLFPHFFHHSFHESSRLLTWCPAIPAVHVGTFHPLMAALSAGRRSLKRAPTRPGAMVDRVARAGTFIRSSLGLLLEKALICEMFVLYGFMVVDVCWCPVGIYIKWLTWKRICENMGWVQFASAAGK